MQYGLQYREVTLALLLPSCKQETPGQNLGTTFHIPRTRAGINSLMNWIKLCCTDCRIHYLKQKNLLQIHVFCDVTPCRRSSTCRRFEGRWCLNLEGQEAILL